MAKVYGGVSAVSYLAIFLIIYNLNLCDAAEIDKSEFYNAQTLNQFDEDVQVTLVKLRQKRQTQNYQKSSYVVPQNATPVAGTEANITHASIAAANATTTTTNGSSSSTNTSPTTTLQVQNNGSIANGGNVVSYTSANRPLLGVNGTGQRKDVHNNLGNMQPTAVLADDVEHGIKKVALSTVPVKVDNAGKVVEQLIDSIDVPENDTLDALKKQNFTVNQTTDHHSYYNSTIYVSEPEAQQLWNALKNITPNPMLSQSHRRAMTVELSFDFPFYGHPVRNVTVATGGFIYTGEYVHSWLAATQYIAPLMANFDTSLSNDSYVRLQDNGTAFTVIWENVGLQDKQDVGNFTFSTTLHKNGDIVFTYIQVPILVNAIQDDKHPVKVGLSDAYIIDKVVYFARRKTIYEYHRVNFASAEINNSTIIYLKALPTCLAYTDCNSCINHKTAFDCAWCPLLNRCSTGIDRKKQEWMQRGCDRAQISENALCPALGERGNNANNADGTNLSPSNGNNDGNNNKNNGNNNSKHDDDNLHPLLKPSDTESYTAPPAHSNASSKELKAALEKHDEPKSVGLAFGVLVPICLVITVLLWVLYAYRNPHTKSGQLLIQYRPSQWSWRRGEARYTAATIHM